VAPLILRELRAESRRPVNYWLRVLAAAAVILVFAAFMWASETAPSELGAQMFTVLHYTLLVSFWIFAPLMTADCISSEQREGTLPLLFLTPLTIRDLIAAKNALHALRVLTLGLAALPVLVMPFVIGGVALSLVLHALTQQVTALVLGIAVGILASTKGGSTLQVMVRAELYALCVAVVCALCAALIGWGPFRTPIFLLGSAVFCSLWFRSLFRASAKQLAETWQDEQAAPPQPEWVQDFSRSLFWQDVFRWDKSRTLDHNPVAWLQEYSWTARLTKWGGCIFLLVCELVLIIGSGTERTDTLQPALIGLLTLGIAFGAAGSFRRERQSGLLELMLVTPLSVRQVIAGRLWGIFSHFFPALAVLIVFSIGDRLLFPKAYQQGAWALLFPNPLVIVISISLASLALMILGLYLSLWRVNRLLICVLTWLLAFVLPAFATVILGQLGRGQQSLVLPAIFQLLLAALSLLLLYRNLHFRNFVKEERAWA